MYFADDVLAYNARVGFLAALADAPETAQDGPGATQEPSPAPSTSRIVTDLEERMRAYE